MCNAIETGILKSQVENCEESGDKDDDEIDFDDAEKVQAQILNRYCSVYSLFIGELLK